MERMGGGIGKMVPNAAKLNEKMRMLRLTNGGRQHWNGRGMEKGV